MRTIPQGNIKQINIEKENTKMQESSKVIVKCYEDFKEREKSLHVGAIDDDTDDYLTFISINGACMLGAEIADALDDKDLKHFFAQEGIQACVKALEINHREEN